MLERSFPAATKLLAAVASHRAEDAEHPVDRSAMGALDGLATEGAQRGGHESWPVSNIRAETVSARLRVYDCQRAAPKRRVECTRPRAGLDNEAGRTTCQVTGPDGFAGAVEWIRTTDLLITN